MKNVNLKEYVNILKLLEKPIINKKDDNKKEILVLSGGGIKGISFIGAFKALEELNYLNNFKILVGASIGALMIALIVIGYKPDELHEFIKKFDLGKMKNINIMNVLDKFGLDDGSRLTYVIDRLIDAKGVNPNITLKELYDKTNKKIIFSSVCINTLKVCYLSHDTFPELSLSMAIRMSVSIPWFYTPVMYKNRMYIDGGCIDNYPIHLFSDQLNKVIGLYLSETHDIMDEIKDIETFTVQVIKCFMEGVNFNSVTGFQKYTISINLKSINIVDYELDINKKEEMYNKGYETIMANLK